MQDRRIDSLVAAHAAATPHRPAITFNGACLDYAALERAVATMAGWLAARGIGIGDRVALYARNHPDSFVTLLAVSRLGAMMVPLNWRLSQAELSWQMADAAPALLIHGPEFTEMATKLATESACPHIALGGDLAAA
ncbi:MAG: AMP-binding protein, partial [Pseudomonadota bacterium]|nr:AMP-binding protein [Pseudomonadota bacterium]